jgi:hypothetical protein
MYLPTTFLYVVQETLQLADILQAAAGMYWLTVVQDQLLDNRFLFRLTAVE